MSNFAFLSYLHDYTLNPLFSFQDVTKSKLENFKYYTSLMLGTLCIVCIFAFLFLVPFVLDPAISTLMHEFVDSPVTCRVSQVEVKHGKSNCKWSSCREGCTADMFQCYQVSSKFSDEMNILWRNSGIRFRGFISITGTCAVCTYPIQKRHSRFFYSWFWMGPADPLGSAWRKSHARHTTFGEHQGLWISARHCLRSFCLKLWNHRRKSKHFPMLLQQA